MMAISHEVPKKAAELSERSFFVLFSPNQYYILDNRKHYT